MLWVDNGGEGEVLSEREWQYLASICFLQVRNERAMTHVGFQIGFESQIILTSFDSRGIDPFDK